jgi:uncharacterized membrane protein
MKTNTALQVIFAFFLGLVVVAFVGIGVNTFYPEPVYSVANPDAVYSDWRLTTGIILLVCATVLLAISLLLPEDQGVLSNGLLLGGVFTMVYAVGMTVTSDRSVVRFVVVAFALAVTIGIGYLKFVRGRRRRAGTEPATSAAPAAEQPELAGRLTVVEQKLDALARALQG